MFVAWLASTVLLVCAGYYAGGLIGIWLRFPPTGIATIWPPTAILLAALLLTPRRIWWMYLLAAVPTHLHLVANFQPECRRWSCSFRSEPMPSMPFWLPSPSEVRLKLLRDSTASGV